MTPYKHAQSSAHITYNLKEGKATTSEWFMTRTEGDEDFCDLEVAEEEEEE
jgi:hypothetical protein